MEPATRFGRYGYRRITALLRERGWVVNHKRVERVWRREGLRVPHGQPKRGRLWPGDGSCVRLRSLRPNHVWAYDFVATRTHDGRGVRLLTIVDEYTRECMAIRAERRIRSSDVIETLTGLMTARGVPEHIRLSSSTNPIADLPPSTRTVRNSEAPGDHCHLPVLFHQSASIRSWESRCWHSPVSRHSFNTAIGSFPRRCIETQRPTP